MLLSTVLLYIGCCMVVYLYMYLSLMISSLKFGTKQWPIENVLYIYKGNKVLLYSSECGSLMWTKQEKYIVSMVIKTSVRVTKHVTHTHTCTCTHTHTLNGLYNQITSGEEFPAAVAQ